VGGSPGEEEIVEGTLGGRAAFEAGGGTVC